MILNNSVSLNNFDDNDPRVVDPWLPKKEEKSGFRANQSAVARPIPFIPFNKCKNSREFQISFKKLTYLTYFELSKVSVI